MPDSRKPLIPRSNGVFASSDPLVRVARDDVSELREQLPKSEKRRSRLCAHGDSADLLHEMVIVLERGTYVRPHAHPNKSESFHVIDGEVDVVFFTDDGSIDDVVSLGTYASGKTFYYRVSEPRMHTVVVRTPDVVVHETTNGPFRREDTIVAPWAPDESDAVAGARFLADLDQRLAERADR